MNNAQKILKYLAIAFGVSLAFTIITSIVTGVLAIFGVSYVIDIANDNIERTSYVNEYADVYSIQIDVSTINLNVIPSDKFKLEAQDIPVEYKVEKTNETLKISGKHVSNNAKLTLYIPQNVNNLDLEIGAGQIDVKDIKLDKLNLKIGAVATNINNIVISNAAKIESGVGEVIIQNSDISNLDMDAGVGNVKFNGYLKGTSQINCGIGNVEVDLLGTEALYKITAEKGVGSLSVNGTSKSNNLIAGNGINTLKISGGIGKLNINY